MTEREFKIKLRTEPVRTAKFFEGLYSEAVETHYYIYANLKMINGEEVEKEDLIRTSGYPVIDDLRGGG